MPCPALPQLLAVLWDGERNSWTREDIGMLTVRHPYDKVVVPPPGS